MDGGVDTLRASLNGIFIYHGVADGFRTHSPQSGNLMLCQLSYGDIINKSATPSRDDAPILNFEDYSAIRSSQPESMRISLTFSFSSLGT